MGKAKATKCAVPSEGMRGAGIFERSEDEEREIARSTSLLCVITALSAHVMKLDEIVKVHEAEIAALKAARRGDA